MLIAETFTWDPAEAPLHIDSSKAAATAYKIASSPAVDPNPSRRERGAQSALGTGKGKKEQGSEIEAIPEESGPEATLDPGMLLQPSLWFC